LGDDVKGQLSAEMLILIAVVLAIVAIAASQLLSKAKESAKTINESTSTILSQTIPCQSDSQCDKIDCPPGKQKKTCSYGVCECQ